MISDLSNLGSGNTVKCTLARAEATKERERSAGTRCVDAITAKHTSVL